MVLNGGVDLEKKRIFEIMQSSKRSDSKSNFFTFAILAAILINLILAVFLTFDISQKYKTYIYAVEFLTVLLFTFEYVLRVWTSDYLYPEKTRLSAALKYMLSFSGVIDFLSFFPFYLPLFFPSGVVAFRIFRVVRILRLFRVNQYYDSLNVISEVLKKKKMQLLSSVFIIFILMVASSLIMYDVEHKAQPDVFTNAFSGFWWATSTLLTIGYGDIYPLTYAGRILGIIIAFLGVGMVAIPTGILSAGFVEQMTEIQGSQETEKKAFCPYCGKKLQ